MLVIFKILEPPSIWQSTLAHSAPNEMTSPADALYDLTPLTSKTDSSKLVLPLAFGQTIMFTPELSSTAKSLYERKFWSLKLEIDFLRLSIGLHLILF